MDNEVVIVLAVLGALMYSQNASAGQANPYESSHPLNIPGYGNFLSPSRSMVNTPTGYGAGGPMMSAQDQLTAQIKSTAISSGISYGAKAAGSYIANAAADATAYSQASTIAATAAPATTDAAGMAALDSAAADTTTSAVVADAATTAAADTTASAVVTDAVVTETASASVWDTVVTWCAALF